MLRFLSFQYRSLSDKPRKTRKDGTSLTIPRFLTRFFMVPYFYIQIMYLCCFTTYENLVKVRFFYKFIFGFFSDVGSGDETKEKKKL